MPLDLLRTALRLQKGLRSVLLFFSPALHRGSHTSYGHCIEEVIVKLLLEGCLIHKIIRSDPKSSRDFLDRINARFTLVGFNIADRTIRHRSPPCQFSHVLLVLLNEGLIRGGESIEDEDIQPENEEPASGDSEAETDEVETEPEEVQDSDDSETDVPLDEIPLDMELAFPISQHNGVTLRNLVNLIYSRGKLIGKATGGHFHVEKGLVEELKDDRCTYAIANFFKVVSDYEAQHGEALEGVKITSEKVIFTGFPTAPDHEHLTAFGHLAILMNQQALTQKRIQAKEVADENEKYALHI